MMVITEFIDCENAFHHFQGDDLVEKILNDVKSAVCRLHDMDLPYSAICGGPISPGPRKRKMMNCADFSLILNGLE
jgi:hypothetical protein